MAQAQLTTSITRPENPTEGAVYYETDTSRLIIYVGDKWHVYNRDSYAINDAGTDELNYAQGIYTDTNATYHLSTSPVLHFDSQHLDGLNKTDLNDTDHVPVWRDRTHARHAYYVQSSNTAYSNWEANRQGADLGGVKLTGTFFKNNLNPNNHTGGTVGSAPEYIHGDGTLFWVIASNASNSYATPHTYNQWYKYSTGQKFFGAQYAANLGAAYGTGYFATANNLTGPSLFMGRRTGTFASIWRGDARGSTTISGQTKLTTEPFTATTSVNGDIRQLGHNYSMTMYEVIWFDSALPIEEMNVVKNYLQNKYAGMHDDYLPASGVTDDLVE
jgi:hypothetical protein